MKTKGVVTSKKTAIFILVLISVSIYCIVSGIWGLTESNKQPLDQVFAGSFVKGNLFEGDVKTASSSAYLEIDHKINYLIPVGKEYYYLIVSDDGSTAISIRADKSFGKSFDDYWRSMEEVVIKGRIKELPYDAESRLNEIKNNFRESGVNFNIIGEYYIDTIGGRLCKMRIVVGICILMEVLVFYIMIRNILISLITYPKWLNNILTVFLLAGMLVILILGIYLLNMNSI